LGFTTLEVLFELEGCAFFVADLSIEVADFAVVLGCCANENNVIATITTAIPIDLFFIKINLKVANHLFIFCFHALE